MAHFGRGRLTDASPSSPHRRFGQAKLIYERLGGVCGEVNKPLYAKKLEDIDAQIRYCSFMLGGSATELDVRCWLLAGRDCSKPNRPVHLPYML